MLVKIFKTGYVFSALSLLGLTILIWLPYFVIKQECDISASSTLLYDLFVYIIGTNYYINLLWSLVLVSVSALLLNRVIDLNDLADKNTMLGLFFFILLISSNPSYILMNKLLLATFFIILMLNALFKLPKSEIIIPGVFNASLFLGLASLFYYPLILLTGFLIVTLFIYQISSWREYVVIFIGVSLPVFFAYVWYFFTNNTDVYYSKYLEAFNFDFRIIDVSIMDIVIAILLLGIIISSIFKLAGSLMEKSIVLRQRLTLVIWLFAFICVIILLFEKQDSIGILLAAPSSIILANIATGMKKLKWFDMYLSFIFGIIFISHYLSLFNA